MIELQTVNSRTDVDTYWEELDYTETTYQYRGNDRNAVLFDGTVREVLEAGKMDDRNNSFIVNMDNDLGHPDVNILIRAYDGYNE